LRRWGLVAIVDEIAGNLRLEMDLAREARIVRRFADAWRGSPDVDIPDVVDGLCTTSVMVQRFSGGVRIDAVAAPEREACARRLVDSYVTQLFELGLFHGDPHPGNLFVMADGRICFHDFGTVGRLDRRLRRALTAFALAFVEQDADWVVDASLDMGLVGTRWNAARSCRGAVASGRSDAGLRDVVEIQQAPRAPGQQLRRHTWRHAGN
jgi:ubiquinone biosynthesis protein